MIVFNVKEELLKHLRQRMFSPQNSKIHVPRVGVYYPSVLAQSCMKAQWNYYQIAMREGQIPDDAILRMGEGIITHEVLERFDVWDKTEVTVEQKVSIGKETITIRGRADALLEDTVYEFKRVSRIPVKIKFEHALQVNFYMEALGKPKGCVVYLGYTDGYQFDVVEHYWTLSDWHTAHLINRAVTLHTLLAGKQEAFCSCRNKRHDVEWERYIRSQDHKKRVQSARSGRRKKLRN